MDVRWHRTSDAAAALEQHAHALLGPGPVTSGRLCPRCAGADHGRPWLRYGDHPVRVSVARAGPHLVTVLADVPVGVDVEVATVDVDPALVLAPGEPDGDLARAWARKEAVLKARGTGLAVPMPEVDLAVERWRDLEAPAGYVAALAWSTAAS